MRVLMLSHMYPSPVNVNAGIFVHEQALALEELGHEVRVVSPKGWAPPLLRRWASHRRVPPTATYDGIQVRYPRRLTLPRGLLGHRNAEMMRRGVAGTIERLHREWGIDVIHAHTVVPDGWAADAVGRSLGVPVVATAHGADVRELPARGPRERQVVREAIERVDQVVAVSGAIRAMAEEIGTPKRPVAVVPNGANGERFFPRSRAEARAELGLDPAEDFILYVGQLKPIKGTDVLTEAMGRLHERPGGSPRLVLIGVGPMRPWMEERFAALGIADRTRFMGRIPHDEISAWFAAADFLVLPSRSEGLPTAACEAAASGRALVATAVGGTPEIVGHEQTGLLVPPEDPVALADAIARLLDDPALVERLGAQAGSVARDRFTWTANALAMQTIYREVAR